MDPSELVYIVATDDDLPVSLQVLRADGMLQPQILSQSLLRHASNDHRDIAVYDEEGNDMAEDVTIEVFEYIMDENGDLFRLNSNPTLNCPAPVNTDSCTKALISKDINGPVIVTNVKADDVQMMTLSQGSSHTSVQHNVQECDNVDGDDQIDINVTAAKSTQVTSALSLRGVTDSNCGNFAIPFSSPAIEKTAETDQNTVTSSALCEESLLPICVSNSQSSSYDFQSGNCSVPSSPESLFHSIPDSASKLDLAAAADNCRPISHISASLSNAEKYTTIVTDTATDVGVTGTSCAVDTAVTSADTSDTTCYSTIQLVQPCVVSFSANCCSSSSSCEHGSQQVADQSILNCVSTSSALADSSCNIESAATVVASCTDRNSVNDETDSDLFMDPMNLKDPVVDCAGECKLDSDKCQFADNLHKPAASSVDNSVHSISSCSSITDYNSCSTKQHTDEQIDAVSETDISKGNLIVSDLSTSKLDHSSASDGSPVQSVHLCVDEFSAEQPPLDTELLSTDSVQGSVIDSALTASKLDHCNANDGSPVDNMHICSGEFSAEQSAFDTELPTGNSVQDSVVDSALNPSELDQSDTNDATSLESVGICPSVLSPKQPASDKELTLNDSVYCAVNKQEVACLHPAADCGHYAVKEFVQQDDIASPSEAPVADGVDDVNVYNMEPTLDAVSTAASKDFPASQPTSDTAGFIVQQNDNTASQSDLPAADGVDGLEGCYLSPTLDEAVSSAVKECLVSQPSSDTTGFAVQQNDSITSPSDVPIADSVDDRGNYNLGPTFDAAGSLISKECLALQPSSDTAGFAVQQNDSVTGTSPSDLPIADGVNDAGCYNLGPTFDSAGTVVSKDCLASQPSSDSAELVMLAKDQQNTDTTANAECQLQPEYTMNHTYNGCRQDLMASSYSSNVDEMRQRLCELHRTKKRLRKLQRNEPPPMCTNDTSMLQTSMDMDALCPVKRKRLKLEAVDQELTEREVLLRDKEDKLNLRLFRLEQHEEDVCRREQILAQYCLSSPSQEISNSVQVRNCDHKSDVVQADCESTRKDIMQRHRPYHLLKQKVPHSVIFFGF